MKKDTLLHKASALGAGALATLAPVAGAAQAREAQPGKLPNVIFIMCDDMGYGDLACYGQPFINTPNIDSLARAGIRFTQAYAGSPVSAPSRATLMTGQHSGHTEVRGNKEYWSPDTTVTYGRNVDYAIAGQHPYDTAHIVLPELMKSLGYRTGMFGKWAGGYEGSPSTPDKRGVDEFYGYICQFQAHLYYPNFLNRYSPAEGDTTMVRVVLEENIEHPMYGPDYRKRTQYSADMIHRRALDWIERQNDSTPFFGLLTYTLPHAELVQPDDSIVEAYKRRFFRDRTWGGQEGSRYNPSVWTHAQFAAMITRLDSYVGEVMDALRRKGLDDNTIVVFTSDNGPHEEGGADPEFFGRDGKLRGLKRSCHEGGIRVPFILSWPGVAPAGTESDAQIAFYDVMPTMAELGGTTLERYTNGKDDGFDGRSFLPVIRGEVMPERPYLYWEFHETDQMAVRSGDWKLIVKRGKPELYNLAADIHEDRDVAAEHPDVVKRLTAIALREHKPSALFPVTLPKH